MTDPTTPDTLTAAAERALEILPGEIGKLIRARIKYGMDDRVRQQFADEVMSMPAPAPAVDREDLAHFVANAISRSSQQHVPVGYRVADALISSGHVTRARIADREDGAALIAAERQRQVESEGWTAEHDDGQSNGELALAALCYTASYGALGFTDEHWPWSEGSWKPTGDRVADLTKAGALLAAEIDRLKRVEKGGVRDGG